MRFLATFGMAMLVTSMPVSSSELRVKVVDRLTGAPVSGVSVCIGSAMVADAHASNRTDESGMVAFQPPAHAFYLNVSGNGYDSITLAQQPRRYDLQLEVAITPGRAKPSCYVKPRRTTPRDGIVISSVDVLLADTESGRVEIKTATTGYEPTHIRVANRSDFTGSNWQDIEDGRSVHYVRGLSDAVFIQVRRRVGDDTNHIDALSEVIVETL